MAKYNVKDGIVYGTNAERLADTKYILEDTAKWYEIDTKVVYIAYNGIWYAM